MYKKSDGGRRVGGKVLYALGGCRGSKPLPGVFAASLGAMFDKSVDR